MGGSPNVQAPETGQQGRGQLSLSSGSPNVSSPLVNANFTGTGTTGMPDMNTAQPGPNGVPMLGGGGNMLSSPPPTAAGTAQAPTVPGVLPQLGQGPQATAAQPPTPPQIAPFSSLGSPPASQQPSPMSSFGSLPMFQNNPMWQELMKVLQGGGNA